MNQATRANLPISERDIVFALTRFARPLAMELSTGEERALAHRHLDFYIEGLCAEQPRHKSLQSQEPRTC